jgi:hypothetical protein
MVAIGMIDKRTDYKSAYTLQFVNKGVGLDLRPKWLAMSSTLTVPGLVIVAIGFLWPWIVRPRLAGSGATCFQHCGFVFYSPLTTGILVGVVLLIISRWTWKLELLSGVKPLRGLLIGGRLGDERPQGDWITKLIERGNAVFPNRASEPERR